MSRAREGGRRGAAGAAGGGRLSRRMLRRKKGTGAPRRKHLFKPAPDGGFALIVCVERGFLHWQERESTS